MTTIPLAHLGDLIVDLPIFGGPVLVLGGWLVWTALRSRRSEHTRTTVPDR